MNAPADQPTDPNVELDSDGLPLNGSDYNSEDLQHLSDLEHVRKRPGMYIGDTTLKGLHHLAYEVVDNSIDEAMAQYAKIVSVTINADGSVTVEDDGRGIPVERHAQLTELMQKEMSTLEGVMTVLKFGGKFEKNAYKTSGGLHGVGVTVVNFLSQWCEVEVSRDGKVWTQPGPCVRRELQPSEARKPPSSQIAKSFRIPNILTTSSSNDFRSLRS